MFEIYVHTSPSGKQYVGYTGVGWRVRWNQHVHHARKGEDTAFYRALRKYGPDAFTHEVLDRLYTAEGAQAAERAWIRELESQVKGYNSTAGGDGNPNPSPECRARMGNRTPRTPEQRAKISAGHLGKKRGPHSAEHRARIAAAHQGKTLSEETKAKLRAANLGKTYGPETRAKKSESMRGHAVSQETRDRISAAKVGVLRTPEQRARMSAASKGRTTSRKGKPLPEHHKAALRAAWARRKAEKP